MADEFRATNGAVLPAPDIASLTCAEQESLMREYTDADYRGDAQPDENHPDRKIFEYESLLAETYYSGCQAEASQFRKAAPAFSKGFN